MGRTFQGRAVGGAQQPVARAARLFRLYPEDLAGSRAHAQELLRAGVLDEAEAGKIRQALDEIERDVDAGRAAPGDGDEDVHTFLERLLVERPGAPAES